MFKENGIFLEKGIDQSAHGATLMMSFNQE